LTELSALGQIRKETKPQDLVEEFNNLAAKDLGSLLARVGLGLKRNVNWYSIFEQSDRLADVLVIGHDQAKKTATFPSGNIRPDDAMMYVAIVCYEGGDAKDAYLIPGSKFKKECKKGKPASVNTHKKQKLEEYSFGVAVKNLKK